MENPLCVIDSKFDQCSGSSSSTAVVCEKEREHVSFDYAHFDSKAHSINIRNMMNRHSSRWIIPYCTVAALLIACGALIGLIAVYVELYRANNVLEANRDLIHAQDLKILNQTHAIERVTTELSHLQDPTAGRIVVPQNGGTSAPEPGSQSGVDGISSAQFGTAYTRWGSTDCPNTASLIYSGVAASGSSSSQNPGGGSNFLCMTSEPDYGLVRSEQQEPRSRIFGVEYRNGRAFGDLTSLHGHDVPCASCYTNGGRQSILMVPGKVTCPVNWTVEYSGFLMGGRYNLMRLSYICVSEEPDTRDGTLAEDTTGTSSFLFPVEGVCGSGGGLPCGPYVDGNELQCVVCSR